MKNLQGHLDTLEHILSSTQMLMDIENPTEHEQTLCKANVDHLKHLYGHDSFKEAITDEQEQKVLTFISG